MTVRSLVHVTTVVNVQHAKLCVCACVVILKACVRVAFGVLFVIAMYSNIVHCTICITLKHFGETWVLFDKKMDQS